MASTAADNRDDFSPQTRDLLGKRAGFICSFPGCRHLTVGPSDDRKSGLSMVGVAAHITAASKGGPRYDCLMSSQERASERNGIWMCQTHGKLIDDNVSVHTVDEIQRWKRQHEEWIFARVANADNHVRSGVATVALENVGMFGSRYEVKLGRHNVVYGVTASGKSTLCQALAALSGGSNYRHFTERFRFCRGASQSAVIEAGIATDDALTTVRLSQQTIRLPGRPSHSDQRIHVEVNGNVAANWPQSLFNIVMLDERLEHSFRRPKDPLHRALRCFSEQLRIPEDVILDSLRDELYLTSALGYRFRRAGVSKIDVRVPDGRQFYLPFNSLSGTEQDFAIVEILLRLLRSDSRPTPWLIIVDSAFFLRLHETTKQYLVDTIVSRDMPGFQTIFCVNFEKDVLALQAARVDSWIGATSFGQLTIHSFL